MVQIIEEYSGRKKVKILTSKITQYTSERFSLNFGLIDGKAHAFPTVFHMLNHLVMCDCLQPHGLKPTGILCPWDSPGKNTGVGGHSLLQGIFLTQDSNLGLPHCRQILYGVTKAEV